MESLMLFLSWSIFSSSVWEELLLLFLEDEELSASTTTSTIFLSLILETSVFYFTKACWDSAFFASSFLSCFFFSYYLFFSASFSFSLSYSSSAFFSAWASISFCAVFSYFSFFFLSVCSLLFNYFLLISSLTSSSTFLTLSYFSSLNTFWWLFTFCWLLCGLAADLGASSLSSSSSLDVRPLISWLASNYLVGSSRDEELEKVLIIGLEFLFFLSVGLGSLKTELAGSSGLSFCSLFWTSLITSVCVLFKPASFPFWS